MIRLFMTTPLSPTFGTDYTQHVVRIAKWNGDRRGKMTGRVAVATSDSVWLKTLTGLGERLKSEPQSIYWLHLLQCHKTSCSYLVGTHDEVAQPLAQYQEIGFKGLILDVPMAEDSLSNTVKAFDPAAKLQPSHFPASV